MDDPIRAAGFQQKQIKTGSMLLDYHNRLPGAAGEPPGLVAGAPERGISPAVGQVDVR